MTPQNNSDQNPSPVQVTARPTARWTGEKTAWWIVFGFIILSIFFMLGLWN